MSFITDRDREILNAIVTLTRLNKICWVLSKGEWTTRFNDVHYSMTGRLLFINGASIELPGPPEKPHPLMDAITAQISRRQNNELDQVLSDLRRHLPEPEEA